MSNRSVFALIVLSLLYGVVTSFIVMLLKVPVGSVEYWAIWIGGGAIVGLVNGLFSKYARKGKKVVQ